MIHIKPHIIFFFVAAVILPLFVLTVLFYGNVSISQSPLARLPNNSNQRKPIIQPQLKLISQETFLKKYTPKPAHLPTIPQASLSGFLSAPSTVSLLPARNSEVPPLEISATKALVIEISTQKILYSKDPFGKQPVASLTKLMTALVAHEKLDNQAVLTISQHAIETPESFAHLVEGERLSVEQLLYAILLESSNDGAVALEEFYNATKPTHAGSFIYQMNQKVNELGLETTSFAEPTGLSAQNQSSAFDIARILEAVFKKEKLAQIMKTPRYITTSQDNKYVHSWKNSNKLLESDESIVGGKTGYTEEAGRSMAVVAQAPNGRYIILVVLDANDRETEIMDMLNWVRRAYVWEK